MTRRLLVTGLVAATLGTMPAVAAAQAQFVAHAGPTAGCTVQSPGGVSTAPISADTVCDVPGPGGGTAAARADATQGHVGARATAAKPLGGNDVPMSASGTARFLDQVIFTPINPGLPAPSTITARLNVAFSGTLAVGALASGARVDACTLLGAVGTCLRSIRSNDGTGTTGSDTSGFTVLAPGGTLQTPSVVVPVNSPIALQLFLEVSAGVQRDGSATADYGSSLAFPTGMDVFVLPPGFTANAPESFLFDNRFYPTGVPVVVAHAGDDRTVDEEAIVTLDGSGSEGQSLTFSWSQLAGPAVELSGNTSDTPSFTAPVLPGGFGAQTLTFELTVSDGTRTSSDTVDVVVRNVNHAPVSDAGTDQAVDEGSPVTLDGSASFDQDGDEFSYGWEQTVGAPVTLDLTDPSRPKFTAPLLSGGGGETLAFALTVSDGALSSTDEVLVAIEQVNHAPTADAGADQTRNEGTQVVLDGSASSDPDGDPLTHSWTQVGGTAVVLSNAQDPTPSFTAPPVDAGGETLVFRLVVSDGSAASPPDEVIVTVRNVNDPPHCDLARPTKPVLWPPNHKLIPVGIAGVTEPNDDQVTIVVDGVTQDEPLSGVGDGDTSPDAVRQGQKALLRSERSGSGNGRIYQVAFTATDNQGGTCSGSITVAVPHDMSGAPAIDDGQLYDSLQP